MTLSELSHALDAELARISAEVGHPVAVVGVHSVVPCDEGASRASVYFDLSDRHAGDAEGVLIALLPAALATDQVLAAIVARAPARTAAAVEMLRRISGAAPSRA